MRIDSTTFPAACAAEICVVVSPAVPPNTTGTLVIARGARAPGTATQSLSHASGLPSAVRREWSVNACRWYGSTWKYVPLSPAGTSASRFTSAAM